MAKLFESIGKLGLALAVGGGIVNSALFNGKSLINVLLFKIKILICCLPQTEHVVELVVMI